MTGAVYPTALDSIQEGPMAVCLAFVWCFF